MSDLSSVLKQISALANQNWKRNRLFEKLPHWEMLWSSVDAIEDAELALSAYLEMDWPNEEGLQYVVLYGVLQILFVQQDAVATLASALDVVIERDSVLDEIREIRNNSIGHPTRRGGGTGWAYNFISRPTIRHSGFELMTSYPDGRTPSFSHVDLPKLINNQRARLKEALVEVESRLEEETMEHKNKFRETSFEDIFPSSWSYHISKVAEATFGNRRGEMFLVDLEVIEDAYTQFKAELERRDEATGRGGLDDAIQLIEYPLKRLRECLTGKDTYENSKDAYIYLSFLDHQFNELREMAKELDEEYQNGSDT